MKEGVWPTRRRSPKFWEMSGSTKGIEEWGVSTIFLRASPGMVRNARPQLPSNPRRPHPGWGLGLSPHGFLGESEPEGFGSGLANSNSEDFQKTGRAAHHRELPQLTDTPQMVWICRSIGRMQPVTQLRWPPFPSALPQCGSHRLLPLPSAFSLHLALRPRPIHGAPHTRSPRICS